MTLRTLVLFVIPLVLASIGVVTVVVTRWQKKRWVLSAEAKRSLTKSNRRYADPLRSDPFPAA